MIKKHLCALLVLVLILPSFIVPNVTEAWAKDISVEEFAAEKHCHEGKCVDRLTGLLEAKIKEAKKERCFPPETVKNQSEWYETHPISLSCFKTIKEIEELSAKLKKVEIYLSKAQEKGTCQNCKAKKSPVDELMSNIGDVDDVVAEVSCSPQRKKEIWNKCGSDALCVLVASSVSTLGPLGNKLIPSSLKNKGCKAGQDSCMTQLAAGFVKAVFGLFEGLWDLLKGAGKLIKKGITNAWNWVWGAEDKSSTSQLAAAKASENEGVFKMLMNDFGGTMSKIWTALVASIKEWLSSSVFCQEWSGTPQFSKCLRPAQGLDCTECKAMITGICSLSGTIIAEIIPAFLTGGIATAAKYGAEGASKLVKLFKVSKATTKAIKASKISKLLKPVTKISKAIKTSKVVSVVDDALKIALTTLKNVMLKPIVKSAKVSIEAMKAAGKSAKVYIMMGPTGPMITFGMKAIKGAGKVIILPFENAMTAKAFELGEKSMAKLLSSKSSKVIHAVRPVMAAEATQKMNLIDEAFKDLKIASAHHEEKMILEAKDKYLKVIAQNRTHVIDEYLKHTESQKLSEVVEELYPELNYGKFKHQLSEEELLKIEDDLLDAIQRLTEGKRKDKFARDYQEMMTSKLRKSEHFKVKTFSRDEVLTNAQLSHEKKIEKILEVINKKISTSEKKKILKAIEESEKVGKGVLHYSAAELAAQKKILKQAGLSGQEADQLIKSGLVGKVRPEDALENLKKVIVPKDVDEVVKEMSSRPEYAALIVNQDPGKKAAIAQVVKVMEEGGMPPAQITSTVKKYEKNFDHVRKLSGADSDAPSLLAEYIRREKQSGLSDEAILEKLEKAFGACK